MSIRYSVIVEQYAEHHYIKNFKKKYKGAWSITWNAVYAEFQRFDSLLETSVAETISEEKNIRIVKTEFRVAGTCESKKTSGNRCIVTVHKDTGVVCVLLVYNKNDLRHSNETAQWKSIIRENYSRYSHLC